MPTVSDAKTDCPTTLAPSVPDVSYLLGQHGFIYTSHSIANGVTQRHPAVLLLTADLAPFVLRYAGKTLYATAAAVAPRIARELQADNVALLSFHVLPSHPAFRTFAALAKPGVTALDRTEFSPLDDELAALHAGYTDATRARRLFNATIAAAQHQLPPLPPLSPKAGALMRLINQSQPLDADALAEQMGLHTSELPQLFTEALRMSPREYAGWVKQRRVLDLFYTARSLTEVALDAGFGDSPQFSRTFQRWYGQSPSVHRNRDRVRVVDLT